MKDEREERELSPYESSSHTIDSRSEFDFINNIRRLTDKRRATGQNGLNSSSIPHPSSLACGIGDDAAVIRQLTPHDTVITADLLVEEIDFHRDSTPPRLLGHKALAVSLSDIAAMGTRPRWALLSLGLPREIWESDFVDRFYEGFFELADRYDVRLIGGDISRTPAKIVIDSIVLGECASQREVYRSRARPGDALFVTGTLGGSAAGLRLIERGARLDKEIADESKGPLVQKLLLRHLRPEPRVGWGLVLGQERLASAMIDISDGLSSDLHHLCSESNVGALFDSARIPVCSVVTELCGRRALDPLSLALHGGEDFELLFTVPADKVLSLPSKVDGIGITHIGQVKEAQEGVRVSEGPHTWPLKPGGWEHFKKA